MLDKCVQIEYPIPYYRADVLSVELLHDHGHRSDQPYVGESCWHNR